MLKNLNTGTRLFILCTAFSIPFAAAIYSLVTEKQIAIKFAQREIAGIEQLTHLRELYAGILTGEWKRANRLTPGAVAITEGGLDSDIAARGAVPAATLKRSLEENVSKLQTTQDSEHRVKLVKDALTAGRNLISRIGDDSYLALDPVLETYYVQDIVIDKVPSLLSRVGEAQAILRASFPANSLSDENKTRLNELSGILQSHIESLRRDVAAAYRGDTSGRLKQFIEPGIARMLATAQAYQADLAASLVNARVIGLDAAALERTYSAAVAGALGAWAITEGELARLLRDRVDELVKKLRISLALTGILGAFSLLVAIITYRKIVRPLAGLDNLARRVRETKDYSLRSNYRSRDEIGRLASSFNAMLAELAAARERESATQSELGRVTRLTTMGEMAASIAHEINQPLAAIVTNANAGLRWLKNKIPDMNEVEGSLKRIVADGHRASGIIGSVRTMVKAERKEIAPVNLNDVVRETLALMQGEIGRRRVAVRTELDPYLPSVVVDRVQVQQVVVNLIMNAAEAMDSVPEGNRILRVTTRHGEPDDVLLLVEDSGPGIDKEVIERIFDRFFTTKSKGMGIGLSICRSIIQAHGGRLWAASDSGSGSTFHVRLPVGHVDDA
jgi:signal transduction histidine kinase